MFFLFIFFNFLLTLHLNPSKMAVSGANLHNVFMLLTLEPHLARNPYLVLHVRRNHLVSDTLRELTMYSDVDLKKPLKVCKLICLLNFSPMKILIFFPSV